MIAVITKKCYKKSLTHIKEDSAVIGTYLSDLIPSYQIHPYNQSKTQVIWNHGMFRFHKSTHHQAQPQFDLHVKFSLTNLTVDLPAK